MSSLFQGTVSKDTSIESTFLDPHVESNKHSGTIHVTRDIMTTPLTYFDFLIIVWMILNYYLVR